MFFLNLQIRDKLLYIIVAIYLLFLAHSEAFKNIAVYLMLGYFFYQLIIGRIALTKDIINISIIAHLFFVFIGIFLGINSKESLGQFMDVIHIVFIFLFFREVNLKFLTYEKVLQFLFVGFAFGILFGMHYLFMLGGARLELHSVGSVNRSAVYMMYIFVTALCFIGLYRSQFSRYLFPFILFLSAISLFISASRMAIFSLPVILIFYYILFKRISIKKTLLLILVFSILIYFIFSFQKYSSAIAIAEPNWIDFLIYKISNGLNGPHRLQIWTSSIYAWSENNLWIGIGVGNLSLIHISEPTRPY